MRASALDARPAREWILLALAGMVSLTLHAAGAVGASRLPPPEPAAPVWVEMRVVAPPEPVVEVEVEPVPEPEPQPVPEPRPAPTPKPKIDEVVEYTPEPEVEPKPAPPDAKPVPRPVQGLSADSFANTGSGDFDARRGNTTSTKATAEALPPEDAGEYAIVPYTAVTRPPKIRYKPTLPIPPEVIEAQIQGRVEIVLTIDGDGTVTEVALVQGLHPAADRACMESMRASRWKPGTRDDAAVTTRNVPYSCRFEMAVD